MEALENVGDLVKLEQQLQYIDYIIKKRTNWGDFSLIIGRYFNIILLIIFSQLII